MYVFNDPKSYKTDGATGIANPKPQATFIRHLRRSPSELHKWVGTYNGQLEICTVSEMEVEESNGPGKKRAFLQPLREKKFIYTDLLEALTLSASNKVFTDDR